MERCLPSDILLKWSRFFVLQRQLAGYKLLIVDELGYVPLSTTGAELLFEVFSQRYERGSTIVTSNLPFDEWTGVFGSERLTGALLDRLVNEVLSRPMRDRKAVARYAGLTGSPDESGAKRREQGLARAGNARVRRGMIQLAWRFLRFQKESALAQWYRARTVDSRLGTRKTMIVALARKLLIGLWRFVTTGETLEGVILRPAG